MLVDICLRSSLNLTPWERVRKKSEEGEEGKTKKARGGPDGIGS
jgi:hypothetical protein